MKYNTYATILLFLVLLCANPVLHAQSPSPVKTDRLLIILNGSAYMSGTWQGDKDRFEAASSIITKLATDMYAANDNIEFGMRVYGHQFAAADKRCNDTRREVPFSKDNLAQLYLRLKDLKPKGTGSVEQAIREAAKTDLPDTDLYRYSIVVITGNTNSNCGDNICLPVNELAKKGLLHKRYLLLLDAKQTDGVTYECFDRVLPVANDYGIDTATLRIIRDFPQKPKPKQVKIVYETTKEPTKPPTKPMKNEAVGRRPVPPPPDTVQVPPPKPSNNNAVVISKNSRITSHVDRFGEVNLLNLSSIGRILIYKAEKGDYMLTNEIYPVGMARQTVKLKEGSYRMVYSIGGMGEYVKLFTVKPDEQIDVWLR